MSSGYYRLGGNVPGKIIAYVDGPVDLINFRGEVIAAGPNIPASRVTAEGLEPIELPTPRGLGFTGNECTHCSSTRMLQTGHCETCQDCGETSACS